MMLPELNKIKGIHPGAILKRELKALGIRSTDFAATMTEHKQTISAILNERRGITPSLSIKMANYFRVDMDYFMCIQACYEVNEAMKQQIQHRKTPNLTHIRKALFWDTHFENLDWEKKKSAIILRILERGNELEIREIIAFYGRSTVIQIIERTKNDFLPSFEENITKYLK